MSDTHEKSSPGVGHDGHESHGDEVLAHPVPMKLLLGVFGMLMVLTVLTVAVRNIDLGMWNIWLALGIAVIKGSLVAMYFMHLRWDSPFNGIILIASLFFVAIFIGTAVLDSNEYKTNYNPPARTGTP